jgi:DoxX-like family
LGTMVRMLSDVVLPFPPAWLIRSAVGGVWLYEGLWCKLLGRGPGQLEVVEAVPLLGARWASRFLLLLGSVELALALWVLSGWLAGVCAIAQTVLLVSLNSGGLLWSRHRIHDPGGMVFKNFAFLVLAWVGAALEKGAL